MAREILVQIVFSLVSRLAAFAVVLFGDQRSRTAVFDFEETVVRIGFAVCAADGVVNGRADFLAPAELESGQASADWHHEHVFPTRKI